MQWPPDTLPTGVSRPVAGPGVDPRLLGTAPRTDGTTQISYNGWPLYFWPPDRTPGTATGQGLTNAGGLWYVLDPAGNAVITKSPEGRTDRPTRQTGGHGRRSDRRSLWSINSTNSILSINSRGSVLSVGSVGSFGSVGSVGSALSVGSVGSFLSLVSLLSCASVISVMSFRSIRATMSSGRS